MKPRGQAQVNLISAVWGLFYFLPGRIPYKFWGFGLLIISIYLIANPAVADPVTIRSEINHLKIFSPPILIQTIHAPVVKEISEDELLQSQGLVKTPDGILPFKTKLRVFATSYDKNCLGCNDTTATGLRAGYGVVAVDPKVIPLGSRLYIPGYGFAVAGDTGGSIKGNKIDLGFDDTKTGWWSSRFVEIYILQ
jgi:3D (Asp-Asp-Asp) domain-containing protein